MKILPGLSLFAAATLSACASGPDLPVDYRGSIKTQADPSEVAACIGQAAAITPVTGVDGLVVDAPGQSPPRRYTVTRTKAETVIMMQGGYSNDLVSSDAAALKCALRPH